MKHALLLLFAAVLPLAAQSPAPETTQVDATTVEAITATTPMRAQEANEVLAASSALIEASVKSSRPRSPSRTAQPASPAATSPASSAKPTASGTAR